MRSPIPLIGLVHRVDIKKLANPVDDGAGGLIPSTEVLVYGKRRCRITKNTGRTSQTAAGATTNEMWQVIMEPSPDMEENMIVEVGPKSIAPAGRYRAVRVKLEIDDKGAMHHTSFLLEQYS